jgi:spermidine synthase
MAWHHLDHGTLGELPLDLYENDGEFMIRVDGLELMNSLCHDSEVALAQSGRRLLGERATTARILIGGLGLGYTLKAFIDAFTPARPMTSTDAPTPLAELFVVEKSPEVLRWYREHFQKRLFEGARNATAAVTMKPADDSKVVFLCEDVAQSIMRAGSIANAAYDLIVLDVDNGPEPVSGESNRALYASPGLEAICDALKPRGALLLWSSFQSDEFAAKAERVGLRVSCERIPLAQMRHDHFIYECVRD